MPIIQTRETKRIADYSGFSGDRSFLCDLITKWQPSSFDLDEKEQEQNLYAWLKQKLPGVPITTQYGIAKGKADIVIQDEHVIELKIAFADDIAEFDRCIGQMERYRLKWVDLDRGPVYLVIVGELEPEFRDMLHQAIKRLDSGNFWQWFFLIEKAPTARSP
jgi:hypothetical protein